MPDILSLFRRSPFAPLQGHMEKVAACVLALKPLFEALQNGDYTLVNSIAEQISELEHAADLAKNDIRNNLPNSFFLAVDRNNLLSMLRLQDSIADAAEDVAVNLTLKKLEFKKEFKEQFFKFLDKNLEAFENVRQIIEELNELLESSFGGNEAHKVKKMVESVAFKEHEADLLQRELLKAFFTVENEISYGTFSQWDKTFHAIAAISNLSEQLAGCVRMTLDVR
jgi:predicted phosphate transport protein (TIGR00153 family)